jgi:hypothetical protein
MERELPGVRNSARDVVLEDGVGGDEERPEQEEQRSRQQEAPADGDGLSALRALRKLVPVDVLLHQRHGLTTRSPARVREPDCVVGEPRPVEGQSRSQRSERERDDDRKQVERDEPGRVPPHHERGEEHECRDHPASRAGQRRAAPATERDQDGAQRHDPEEDVETQRGRAEQLVAEETQEERRPE